MPKVPEYNHRPLKIIYNPKNSSAKASMKQKNFILTLCERRKIEVPDINRMTSGEAAQFISNLVD